MTRLLWQPYDEQGRPVMNGGASKLKMVMEGRLHGSAHVWIWRKQAAGSFEVAVQKRADAKINWPGFLDKSAGGHISYGEDPLQTALRKAKQEIGVQLDAGQLRLIGIHRWRALVDAVDMIENEYQWLYTAELSDLRTTVPTREVAAVEWNPLDQVVKAIDNAENHRYVPYGRTYFLMLGDAIKQMAR